MQFLFACRCQQPFVRGHKDIHRRMTHQRSGQLDRIKRSQTMTPGNPYRFTLKIFVERRRVEKDGIPFDTFQCFVSFGARHLTFPVEAGQYGSALDQYDRGNGDPTRFVQDFQNPGRARFVDVSLHQCRRIEVTVHRSSLSSIR